MRLARRLLQGLEKRKLTIAVAESYTGGRLQDALTDIPGSSKSYVGGIVAYDNKIKTRFLGVSPRLLRKHGAVSAQVALEMARGARKKFHADVGVATTGIAGPRGATPQKPRGLSFVAVVFGKKAVTQKRLLQGSRVLIKDRGAAQALALVVRVVLPKPLRRRPVSRKT